MLAIIRTGGKQYIVEPDQKIEIEKINKKAGEEVIFDNVLLLKKNNKVEIGAPLVKKAKVIGRVLSQKKSSKVTAFKFIHRTRYGKKKGHRQLITEVKIDKIELK